MIPDDFLFSIANPQVFTGLEINVVRRPLGPGDIGVCLVFPDTYEIGMSHSGLKILYHMLNRSPGVVAERAFLPPPEAVALFRERDVPLFSLERRQPLSTFDLVGVSLPSELNFTNIPLLLDLAKIPLRNTDRSQGIPLVGAGGISICNPEPLRDFFDFFAFGDGEVLYPDILERICQAKKNGWSRETLLRELSAIEGIYVPALVPLQPSSRFFLPDLGGRTIQKRVLRDFQGFPTTAEEIVPIGNTVFNRMNVEIARGCPNTCRFCQARSYYSPFRTRSGEQVLRMIADGLAGTGYEAFSLASLSSGDHPELNDILPRIPRLLGTDISFSVPSLRPASLGDKLLKTIGLFRRTGITIVPEAGSLRLRRVLNKNVSDEEILHAVALALKYGWQKIKLYFMIGLPTETEKDLDAIPSLILQMVDLCHRERKRLHIHASFSPFVPKPHTPFQWAEMKPLPYLTAACERIRRPLARLRQIELDFHDPGKALVETILTRGDARVGALILHAYRQGEVFTAWSDSFHFPIWERLIGEMGGEAFTAEIPPDTQLPWNFISLGGSSSRLWGEYERARLSQAPEAEPEIIPISPGGPPETEASPVPESIDFEKIRIFYSKRGDFRFFSHLSMMQYLERLLRRSGFRFKNTEGFHRRIRMSLLPPLPVAAESEMEVAELFIEKGFTAPQILERLRSTSPDFGFSEVRLPKSPVSLGKNLQAISYRFGLASDVDLSDEFRSLLTEDDRADRQGSSLLLRIDYAKGGQERFPRIYKQLDPGKQRLRWLVRTGIELKHAD